MGHTAYHVFPRASIFRYVHESIKIVKIWYNLANKVDLKALTWICEKFTRVDLIHDFRLEFGDKTWRENNLMYGIDVVVV